MPRLAFLPLVLVGLAPGLALAQPALPTIADLVKGAGQLQAAKARAPLGPLTPASFKPGQLIEPGHVPSYQRVLTAVPDAAGNFGAAFRALLYGGTVEPETKMAMGLQIARVLHSPYAAVHMRRLLAGTEKGQSLLGYLERGGTIRPEQLLAVNYAAWLTQDVHGVDDARFREVRGYYRDPQIVELTMTVSFFNYFTRLMQATNVPVEAWALTPATLPAVAPAERNLARIGLITDEQMAWAATTIASRTRPGGAPANNVLGLGIVNSQRAMNLVPDIAAAWRAFTSTIGPAATVSQDIKLQISFAVSTANGCRYCTLHQVLGLRRLGVSPDKLLQMQKDDSALTPRELVAVKFARKLTATPAAVTDADYQAIRAEFGERGALEVVLQTCNFAFMNRFTDNLGLPSEDEAVRVYQEVYGPHAR
jgi:AhpD family alkylhydroperoxidase